MIDGEVTDDGVPIIRIELAGETFEAVIDTGFNGDLELPLRLREPLKARFVNSIVSNLAAGQTVVEDVYSVEVPFDGRIVKAEVSFAYASEILIGTRLLRRHHLEIDFVKQTVRLERLQK
jgi:clan AA aspartic protease